MSNQTFKNPKTILSMHNIRPSKTLSQNFIMDFSTVEKIVKKSLLDKNDIVMEVGAGLGVLTEAISYNVKKVFAVEIDRRLLPLLQERVVENSLQNVQVINQDIMRMDIAEVLKTDEKLVLFGNLPYSISSQIIIKAIKNRSKITKAVFMLQKELADRLVADVGTKEYGRLSVMLSYCADIKKIADFKPDCFFPKPKVNSSVIKIEFKNEKTSNEDFFFKVIKCAFSKKRKTIFNSLAMSDINIDKNKLKNIFETINIDKNRRAETFTYQEFIKLKDALHSFYN